MNKKDLAINGGRKTRVTPFPAQPGPSSENTLRSVDYETAVLRVLQSQVLSGFRGNSSPAFYGGPEIQAFEKEVEEKFNTKHVITCNSATSGLFMACAAIGLKPGDEVITTAWSMSCSATAPLAFGAIPVFADIEDDYFCLDPHTLITTHLFTVYTLDGRLQPQLGHDV